jgi:MerR family transcriptional regulator, light-induced transcriptional regulator
MQDNERKAGRYIKENTEILLERIMNAYEKTQEKYKVKFDKKNTGMYLSGIKYHLAYLSESLMFSSPELFFSALSWGKVYMPSIKVPAEHINIVLISMRETLKDLMPQEIKEPAIIYINEALKKIDGFSAEIPCFLNENKILKKESKKYLELLLKNDRMEAGGLVLDLVKKGKDIKDIYLEIFQNTQYELGRLWQTGVISVAQEHYCTASTQIIMSQLYPYIFQGNKTGNVFIGACVSGELHEIGIRMLSDMLELNGWDTYYLGANMPVESIIKTIIDKKAAVLGLSATMTFHVEKIEQQIKAVRQNSQCSGTKIITGGYVFKISKNLWKKIGADAYGEDLIDSLSKINNMHGTAA